MSVPRLMSPALGIALVGALTLSSCSVEGDFAYVNNSQEKTFVKVPRKWKRFTITREIAKDRTTPIDIGSGSWHIVFDSATEPDADNVAAEVPSSLVGEIEITEVNTTFHEVLNVKISRSHATDFAFDPVEEWQNGNEDFELIDYQEITTGTGMRGNRVVFNWRVNGTDWVTIDQTTYLNPATSKYYRMLIKCEALCFKENLRLVRQIADSFQVRA